MSMNYIWVDRYYDVDNVCYFTPYFKFTAVSFNAQGNTEESVYVSGLTN